MRRLLSVVLTLMMVVGLTACGSDDSDDEATTTTEAPAEPTPVTITTDGKTVTAEPGSVAAGLATLTLKNSSGDRFQVILAKLDPGKTIEDVKAFPQETPNAPPPPFIKLAGGPTAAPGGEGTYTTVLTEGTYGLAGFADTEAEGEDIWGTLTVTAGDSDVELPQTEATITGTEYSYAIKGLRAGRNEVTLRNTGGLPHIFVVVGLAPEGDLDAALAHEGEGPPPGITDFQADLAYLDPGLSGIASVELPAGKYGMVCFLANAPGGKTDKPHYLLGMKQEFSVS